MCSSLYMHEKVPDVPHHSQNIIIISPKYHPRAWYTRRRFFATTLLCIPSTMKTVPHVVCIAKVRARGVVADDSQEHSQGEAADQDGSRNAS